jgi:hypothetical protein
MANKPFTEQDLHVHNRIMQVWGAIANLQAQTWAAHKLLEDLAKVEGIPKQAADLLNSYEERVQFYRGKIPIPQEGKPPKVQ